MAPEQDLPRGGAEDVLKAVDAMQEVRFWGFWAIVVFALLMLPRCIAAWKGTALPHIEKRQRRIIRALAKKGVRI